MTVKQLQMKCAYYASCIPLTVAALAAVHDNYKAVQYQIYGSSQFVRETLQLTGDH